MRSLEIVSYVRKKDGENGENNYINWYIPPIQVVGIFKDLVINRPIYW